MAHCVRDPDILKMVAEEQLKLVLNIDFPEHFTFCPSDPSNRSVWEEEHAHSMDSIISADEEVSPCAALHIALAPLDGGMPWWVLRVEAPNYRQVKLMGNIAS